MMYREELLDRLSAKYKRESEKLLNVLDKVELVPERGYPSAVAILLSNLDSIEQLAILRCTEEEYEHIKNIIYREVYERDLLCYTINNNPKYYNECIPELENLPWSHNHRQQYNRRVLMYRRKVKIIRVIDVVLALIIMGIVIALVVKFQFLR